MRKKNKINTVSLNDYFKNYKPKPEPTEEDLDFEWYWMTSTEHLIFSKEDMEEAFTQGFDHSTRPYCAHPFYIWIDLYLKDKIKKAKERKFKL